MSSVNPPDGGYKYYQQNIDQLEDDLDRQSKRAKEKEEARVRRLEDNYASDLRDQREDMERAVRNAKEDMNDALARERANNKSDLENLKHKTYDKFGRYHGEADNLKQELEESERAGELQHQSDRAHLAERESSYDRKIDQLNKDHAAELASATREARDAALETYHRKSEADKQSYLQDHKQLDRQYSDLERRHLDEVNEMRREYNNALTDTQREYDHKAKADEHATDTRFQKLENEFQRKEESNARATARSHAQDTAKYRKQVRDLLATEGRYAKEKGQGTRDAVREYDNEWRSKLNHADTSYRKELDGLKNRARENESYLAGLQDRALKDKDLYYANLIRKQNQDRSNDRKRLEQTFQIQSDDLARQNQKDRQNADASMERMMSSGNLAREEALKSQARANQRSLSDVRKADKTQIKALEDALHYARTSGDPGVLSPSAERAMRQHIAQQYEKNFDAEKDRNERSRDRLQSDYQDRLSKTVAESRSRETEITRRNAAERHQERGELMATIQDTEASRDEQLRSQEFAHSRENDTMNRNFARTLEQQRREYESILSATRDNAQAKIQELRQEAEFQAKSDRRAFAARQNEIIRDYEKKLADQKQELGSQLEDLKAQSERAIHESERKTRRALEEQSRSYEQRLAQQEQSFKERERTLTQNYEQELDNLRRSNAALIAKKS